MLFSYDKDSEDIRLAQLPPVKPEDESPKKVPTDIQTHPKAAIPTYEPAVQKVTPNTATQPASALSSKVKSPPSTPTKMTAPPPKTSDPPKATVTPNANVPVVNEDIDESPVKDMKTDEAEVCKESKSAQTVSSGIENKLAQGYRFVFYLSL